MTVIELRELLSQFDDDLIVMIPNICWRPKKGVPVDVPAKNVSQGVNEYDGCIFISDYEEDNDDE